MPGPDLSLSQKLRYGAEAFAFFLFMGFFRLLGVDAASALGGFIGREIFARTGATRRARENLAAALPEKSSAEQNAIIRTMWDNLGRTVAEYAHLDKFGVTGPNPRIQVEHIEIGDAMRNKSVLLLSGHFANWEIMPIAAAQFGLEGAVVYRPPNNPYVDRYIARAARVARMPRNRSANIAARGAFSPCCAAARPSCCWPTRRPMRASPFRFSAATP